MELPNLGHNCSLSTCKKLDFLPMKCDACYNTFCNDHVKYITHNCPESYKKDNQVPICPLCNKPIPIKPGQSADVEVGNHIDRDCQSDPAKEKRKIFTNRCSSKGCKSKELIPFTCSNCKKNFCIKHRLEVDHSCGGYENTGRSISNAGAAALSRLSQGASKISESVHKKQSTIPNHFDADINRSRGVQTSNSSNIQHIQGNMTEDEAMAKALALSVSSMPDTNSNNTETAMSAENIKKQEEEDLALAQALSLSETQAQNSSRPAFQRSNSNCQIS